MPANRGAIPLALLVAAALAAGIVAVAARIGPEEERPQAQPRPASPSPEPAASPSPLAQEPSETLETPEAETQPTTEPSPQATKTPAVDSTPLARTGGPTLPLYIGGLILIAGSALVWRFSRARNEPAQS